MNKLQHQNLIRQKLNEITSLVDEFFQTQECLNLDKLLKARREFGSELLEYRFRFGDLGNEGTPSPQIDVDDPVVCGVRESELRYLAQSASRANGI